MGVIDTGYSKVGRKKYFVKITDSYMTYFYAIYDFIKHDGKIFISKDPVAKRTDRAYATNGMKPFDDGTKFSEKYEYAGKLANDQVDKIISGFESET